LALEGNFLYFVKYCRGKSSWINWDNTYIIIYYINYCCTRVFYTRHTLLRFDQLLSNEIIVIVHHEGSPVTHLPVAGAHPEYVRQSRVNVCCLFVCLLTVRFRDVRFVFVCQKNYTKNNSKAKTTQARRHSTYFD